MLSIAEFKEWVSNEDHKLKKTPICIWSNTWSVSTVDIFKSHISAHVISPQTYKTELLHNHQFIREHIPTTHSLRLHTHNSKHHLKNLMVPMGIERTFCRPEGGELAEGQTSACTECRKLGITVIVVFTRTSTTLLIHLSGRVLERFWKKIKGFIPLVSRHLWVYIGDLIKGQCA